MSDEPLARAPAAGRPRRSPGALAAGVLIVQALTLLALWLLQSTFGGG
ncbi:MAG TPA: hypothetical protein VMM12_06490 [Longimicrobiales bacterium]|nr:hypothetical protein [Longimicrobiales bacterium]